jgi:D-alanyl-D-alanine carboxypeptidase
MRLRKHALLAFGVWLSAGCGGPVAVTPVASAPPIVRAPVDQKFYPGISVAVGNAGGVVAANAYGLADVDRQIPMTTTTTLRVASVSKSITAAAVLALDQAGAISIDNPILTYVPQYTAQGGRITVRELLNHTSGIPGHSENDPVIHGDGPIPPGLFFSLLNAEDLTSIPGTAFDYGNENYYLLALLVQNVSGLSFGDYLQQHIFAPAGMTASYSDDGRTDPHLALGYVHRTPADPFLQCPAPDPTNSFGAGGIVSTASDIVRFDLFLTSGKLLDAKHLSMMFVPSINIGGGMSYALGWFVNPGNLIQHEGDFTIASSINAIYPDGTAVVEIANGADLSPDFDRVYFATQLQNQYGTTPFPLGTPSPVSLLSRIAPFTSCQQLNENLFTP